MAGLTVADFDLASATVNTTASLQENGRATTLPLPPLVAVLREYLAGKAPTEQLFPGGWADAKQGVDMMRADLAAAELPYADAAGATADFHSLRARYASELVKAGVPLATAQKLLGHSTPTLTAKHYVKLGGEELSRAVSVLTVPTRRGSGFGVQGSAGPQTPDPDPQIAMQGPESEPPKSGPPWPQICPLGVSLPVFARRTLTRRTPSILRSTGYERLS